MKIDSTPFRNPKIDPAFHKFIKVYVDSLEQFERSPMEGKFSFPPDFIEPIIQKSGWLGPYDSELSHGKNLFRNTDLQPDNMKQIQNAF